MILRNIPDQAGSPDLTEVEQTDEFGGWREATANAEQESGAYSVALLEAKGTALGHPHSSKSNGSRHARMREPQVQHQGRPYGSSTPSILAGDKTGDGRFYERMIPEADRIYDEHLEEIAGEVDDKWATVQNKATPTWQSPSRSYVTR